MSLFDDIARYKSSQEIWEALDLPVSLPLTEDFLARIIGAIRRGRLVFLRDRLEHYFQNDYTLTEQIIFEQNETRKLAAEELRIASQINWQGDW